MSKLEQYFPRTVSKLKDAVGAGHLGVLCLPSTSVRTCHPSDQNSILTCRNVMFCGAAWGSHAPHAMPDQVTGLRRSAAQAQEDG